MSPKVQSLPADLMISAMEYYPNVPAVSSVTMRVASKTSSIPKRQFPNGMISAGHHEPYHHIFSILQITSQQTLLAMKPP